VEPNPVLDAIEDALVELRRIRFRVGVCALIMALPFIVAGLILFLLFLGAMSR